MRHLEFISHLLGCISLLVAFWGPHSRWQVQFIGTAALLNVICCRFAWFYTDFNSTGLCLYSCVVEIYTALYDLESFYLNQIMYLNATRFYWNISTNIFFQLWSRGTCSFSKMLPENITFFVHTVFLC